MTIKQHVTLLCAITLGLFLASGFESNASGIGKPKTSQHASFKPADFERLAIIVKPVQEQQQSYMMNGFGGGGSRGQQTQFERMIEQDFMRTLIGDGYTLVSRADLDSAMIEQGLDQAHMTDEKYTEEAGKILHVSAILVVSVDDFKTSPVRQGGYNGYGGGYGSQETYMVVASVAARLVKIDDNMVMWTGDLTVNQPINTQDQDSLVLSLMAEAIAKAFPPFTPPAPGTK